MHSDFKFHGYAIMRSSKSLLIDILYLNYTLLYPSFMEWTVFVAHTYINAAVSALFSQLLKDIYCFVFKFSSFVDVDECTQGVCHESAICENYPGSYSCNCLDGFFKANNSQCIGKNLFVFCIHNFSWW